MTPRSCTLGALALLALTACAHQPGSCPKPGELALLAWIGDEPTLLAGQPTSSRAYVALRHRQPPRRVTLTRRFSQYWMAIFYLVKPPHRTTSAEPVTFFIGPHRGDPARLSLECEQPSCHGHLQVIDSLTWLRVLTISRDGKPWIELHAKGVPDSQGIAYELRAPCASGRTIAENSPADPG